MDNCAESGFHASSCHFCVYFAGQHVLSKLNDQGLADIMRNTVLKVLNLGSRFENDNKKINHAM